MTDAMTAPLRSNKEALECASQLNAQDRILQERELRALNYIKEKLDNAKTMMPLEPSKVQQEVLRNMQLRMREAEELLNRDGNAYKNFTVL